MNYGARIGEHKGLVGPALLDGVPHLWETGPPESRGSGVGPTAWRALFSAEPHVDLFLDTAFLGQGHRLGQPLMELLGAPYQTSVRVRLG